MSNIVEATNDDVSVDLELMDVSEERSKNDTANKRNDDTAGESATPSSIKRGGSAVSQWVLGKLKPNNNNNNTATTNNIFKGTNSSDNNSGASPDRTVPDDDDDDREESSSSSSSSGSNNSRKNLVSCRRRYLHSATTDDVNNDGNLSGIEVEIDSSVSGDDCLYRKRYLNTIWMIHKQQIMLGFAFLFVFLFGILIGACGTGQCGSGKSGQLVGVGGEEDPSSLVDVKWQDLPPGCNPDQDNNSEEVVDATTAAEQSAVGGGTDPSTSQQQQQPYIPLPDAITNQSPTFLGPNTFVFDPTMTTAEIQSKADSIFKQQQNNEMGMERYALLFQPGTYGSVDEPLMIQIGYYTEVAGLGASPTDVNILGKIEVYNRCFEPDPYADGKFIPTDNSEEGLCFALNSFWRGLSNLSIRIVSRNQDSCRATAMFWAISQAASMRRVNIEGGDLSLMDYCSNPAYASGGFVADSKAAGKIISGSQQQFITRNSHIAQWDGAAWNQVLVGVVGAPDDSGYPNPPITSLDSNPLSREKPYLFVNEVGEYHVRVPISATATRDVSWSRAQTPGRTIPISDFLIASPSDSIASINGQLAAGKNLLLTPGQYDCAQSIMVTHPDTVVLGLGLATLTAVDGATPIKISSQPGIIVAGVTLDAGLALSPVLLQVGDLGDSLTDNGDPNNPITLSDVYFRVGGPHVGRSNVCLEINSNHVLVDHTWVWRADHGVEDFDKTDGFDGDNERWRTNTGLNGVVVNGNDVTATGLFVEHFQEYNLVWNGERGRVYFFQNELPYEPPSQEEWTADDGTLGWAAYKVNSAVTTHEVWCGGVYCYNRNNPSVVTANAFEVPVREGVSLHHVYTRNLSGPGTIQSIVNGVGEAVTDEEKGPFYVVKYPEKI